MCISVNELFMDKVVLVLFGATRIYKCENIWIILLQLFPLPHFILTLKLYFYSITSLFVSFFKILAGIG